MGQSPNSSFHPPLLPYFPSHHILLPNHTVPFPWHHQLVPHLHGCFRAVSSTLRFLVDILLSAFLLCTSCFHIPWDPNSIPVSLVHTRRCHFPLCSLTTHSSYLNFVCLPFSVVLGLLRVCWCLTRSSGGRGPVLLKANSLEAGEMVQC